MAKYYSPDGNIEVWDTKPDGYYTVDEWQELHPYIQPTPTKEEQIAALDTEFAREKTRLCEEYTDSNIHGDMETAEAIIAEMGELETWYDTEYEKIINAETGVK